MAVAVTSCEADPTRARNRKWTNHRWSCTGCGSEIRIYQGLGWHHYVQLKHRAPVTVEYIEVPVTSMPPRRALFEIEAELTEPARPHLYLVPPLTADDHPTSAGPLAA